MEIESGHADGKCEKSSATTLLDALSHDCDLIEEDDGISIVVGLRSQRMSRIWRESEQKIREKLVITC